MKKKTRRLREWLRAAEPLLVAGVHDGLSARLAEQAGFGGLWASGFCISASKGLPDAGLVTMTEHLQSAREIDRASSLPVIADVDNGFGDAMNVARTVREYEGCGIAGLSLEDQHHPKRCSFYEGVPRDLVTPREFADKIHAAKSAQQDPDFVVIARTEALVVGRSMNEAFDRSSKYVEAGADLILAHSKSFSATEVVEFSSQWSHDVPLVVVPTTFHSISAPELHQLGFQVIIFANQGLRAAITAMQTTFDAMARSQSLTSVEDEIAPLKTVFSLVGVDEVIRADAKRTQISTRLEPTN
jgi:phosphoenolpyruvate phosphomutase